MTQSKRIPFTREIRIKEAVTTILTEIGEDVTREGLVETPERVWRFWQEFIDYNPGNLDVTFESVETDQMVAVSGIRVFSLCEHHLLPFWCDLSIGYVTREKVLGLSKIARIAHKYAHKLQIQERMVHQIADEVEQLTGSPDVAVMGSGTHLCMLMRGVKTEAVMHTSVLRGVFREDVAARNEFFSLLKQ